MALLQKRPIILRSLLIEATPYVWVICEWSFANIWVICEWWHDSYIRCETWLTHTHVAHDLWVICEWRSGDHPKIRNVYDLTHTYVCWYVWHDSSICATWLIHMSSFEMSSQTAGLFRSKFAHVWQEYFISLTRKELTCLFFFQHSQSTHNRWPFAVGRQTEMRHITSERILSHMNESCHVSMGHVTCDWVASFFSFFFPALPRHSSAVRYEQPSLRLLWEMQRGGRG